MAQTNTFPSSGNVGIGTLTPQFPIDIFGTGTNGDVNIASVNFPTPASAPTLFPSIFPAYRYRGRPILRMPGNATNANFHLNTAVGDSAGSNVTSGTYNTLVGKAAGTSITNGTVNTCIGVSTGIAITGGDDNTLMGGWAGQDVSGSGNTYIGRNSGRNGGSGNLNTYVGYFAGDNADKGSSNIAMGSQAGYSVLTPTFSGTPVRNIVFGNAAGRHCMKANSTDNILIGTSADLPSSIINSTAISNAIAIGANTIVTASNSMILGNNTARVGIGLSGNTTPPGNNLEINATDALGTVLVNTSGLKFRQLTANSPTVANVGNMGVLALDLTGNIIYVPKGVEQGSSASFSSLRVSDLSGVGDRKVVADANGNLKISTLAFDEFWRTDGNATVGHSYFLGTTDAADLIFKTNSDADASEKMVLTTGGNLGIGTTTPRSRLDIASSTGEASIFGVDQIIGFNDLRFYTDNLATSESMIIDASGNVGIGETFPVAKLHIVKPANSPGNFSLKIDAQNTPALVVNHNANVGIGTDNPGFKLHVEGGSAMIGTPALGGFFGKLQVVEIAQNQPAIVGGDTTANSIWFIPNLGGVGYNYLSQAGDAGIIFRNQDHNTGNAGLVIAPHSASFAGIRMDKDGNVAIGSTIDAVPSSLSVAGHAGIGTVSDPAYNLKIAIPASPPSPVKAFAVIEGGSENFLVYGDGFVFAKRFEVATGAFAHPDYVFENNYQLKNIGDLQAFIDKNKHLPNFLSSTQYEKLGKYDLLEMDMNLLKTSEELALYVIELKKMIDEQNNVIDEMKKEIKELKKRNKK